jgi:Cdc6-like AAA superfamily ATPase
MAFDPAAQRIYVQYLSGAVQHFDDCDAPEWARLISATSKGEYVTRRLARKPNQHASLRSVTPRPVPTHAASRHDYHNAFRPAHEMDDPQRFAGREAQIRAIADAMLAEGSCILLYGERGIGKSSLAVQAQLLAMGDSELLELIGSPEYAVPDSQTFLALYVSCSDSVTNVADLVQRLINVAEDVVPDSEEEPRTRLVDRSTKRGVSMKFFNAEATRTYAAAAAHEDFTRLAPVEQLQRVVRRLCDAYGQPVLFVVDELDRVADKSGLASLVRNLSSRDLKLLLVGIADNWSDLMLDHRSVERIVAPIRVPLMTRAELAQIIDLAVEGLLMKGFAASFDDDSRTRVVDVSGGFPWYVHTLGQASLMHAFERSSTDVRGDDVVQAVRHIVQVRDAEKYRALWRLAASQHPGREAALRLIASSESRDVAAADVRVWLGERGIIDGNQILKDLMSEPYGEILISLEQSGTDLVRFRDGMFREYVFLRPAE